jgi:hypothetical protein
MQNATRIRVIWTLGLAMMIGSIASAQTIAEPGFESYSVSPGGFVRSSTGAWSFYNDACVVEPFAPNSSNGVFSTWSATRAAYEGQQYACTYAGGDFLLQSVLFPEAGTYEISVRAFAPAGMIQIPPQPTLPLIDGQFRFYANGPIGPTFTVPVNQDWTLYLTQFTVSAPGYLSIGVSNPLTASYFINYDAMALRLVPEPGMMAVLVTTLMLSRRRSAEQGWRFSSVSRPASQGGY